MSITASLFIVFVVVMAGAVGAMAWRGRGARSAVGVLLALMAWFAYVALLARFGILARTDARPPGVLFMVGPVVAYLIVALLTTLSRRGWRIASAIPLALLIGLQAFRIVVELFIHRLYADGVVPRMLTFTGANVDIYIGLSALFVAVATARYRHGKTIALIWNLLGLAALANVVTFAILTAPGPFNFLHTDPPNRMFVTFPFMFIPAFFVPLAITLHLLAIRAICVCLPKQTGMVEHKIDAK